MLKSFLYFIAVGFSTVVFAQTLTPKVLATAGNYATGGGLSLSQTIGETFNKTLQNGSLILTQGEQQPPSGVIPLPISWMDVYGNLNHNSQAVLNWQVEEISVSYYLIEKNTSAGYVTIGRVYSLGNGDHAYTFTDPDVLNGEASYRVKQVDVDGKYSYSKIINLKTTANYSIVIYPNPAITTVKIIVNNPALKNTVALLYDPNGKKVKEISIVNSQEVDLSTMIPGMYLLQFADQSSFKILKLDKY